MFAVLVLQSIASLDPVVQSFVVYVQVLIVIKILLSQLNLLFVLLRVFEEWGLLLSQASRSACVRIRVLFNQFDIWEACGRERGCDKLALVNLVCLGLVK